MSKGKGSKYQKKVQAREQQERKVPKVVKEIREKNKDKFLWASIPLTTGKGTPLVFSKLSPYYPVRTRDGRPVFLLEIDETLEAHRQVKAKIPSTEGSASSAMLVIETSIDGRYRVDGSPCPFDLLNISPDKWNKMFASGKVSVQAIE